MLACGPGDARGQEATEPGDHALGVGVNALAAGVVAGLVRKLQGDEFRPAFVRGALGGGIAYRWASLSAGAFVLRSSTRLYGDRSIRGSQRSGVILLADDGRGDPEAAFRHERVHVLQRDFTFQAWGAPLQDRLFGRDPLYRSLTRFLDVDAILPLTEWVLLEALGIPYRDRPREIEAELLSR